MAGSALFRVQEAVYGVLSADATLGALVTGVFDAPPENQTHPYLVVGDGVEYPMDTLGATVKRVDIDVTAWSAYPGMKESIAILDRAIVLLHRVALAITGYQHIGTVQTPTQVTRGENDGTGRRGVARFSVWVKQS